MAIKAVHVTMEDDSKFDAEVIMADVIRTEDKFNSSFAGRGDDIPVKMLAFVGYAALKRTREIEGTFEDFWPRIKDMDLDTDEGDEDGGSGEA